MVVDRVRLVEIRNVRRGGQFGLVVQIFGPAAEIFGNEKAFSHVFASCDVGERGDAHSSDEIRLDFVGIPCEGNDLEEVPSVFIP